MDTDNNIPPKLKDNEILAPFVKYLVPGCVDLAPGEKLFVYRTQNIIPVDDYGESPRPKRKYGNEALKRKLTQAEVDALPENKRNKIIGDWGLSCNVTIRKTLPHKTFGSPTNTLNKKVLPKQTSNLLHLNEEFIFAGLSSPMRLA